MQTDILQKQLQTSLQELKMAIDKFEKFALKTGITVSLTFIIYFIVLYFLVLVARHLKKAYFNYTWFRRI